MTAYTFTAESANSWIEGFVDAPTIEDRDKLVAAFLADAAQEEAGAIGESESDCDFEVVAIRALDDDDMDEVVFTSSERGQIRFSDLPKAAVTTIDSGLNG